MNTVEQAKACLANGKPWREEFIKTIVPMMKGASPSEIILFMALMSAEVCVPAASVIGSELSANDLASWLATFNHQAYRKAIKQFREEGVIEGPSNERNKRYDH